MMNFFWSYQQLQSEFPTIKYGYLYNWYAATNVKNIANTGWHLPTSTELASLRTYLGGSSVAGGKLKETGLTYWDTPNTGATNEVGFNGRGAGIRDAAGTFATLKLNLNMWISDDGGSVGLLYRLYYTDAVMGFVNSNKKAGMSIRLIKDSGTATSYTGNDGKVYRCVTINGVTYTADNLAETKYRDGSSVTVVTDSTTWASLTTEAMCAHGNDTNNV